MDTKKKITEERDKAIDIMLEKDDVESLIKDNKIEFEVKGKLFRVRKPNNDERREAISFKRKKKIEFMKDDSMLPKKQWVKLYKKKGIDTEEMDKQIKNLVKEMEQLYIKGLKVAKNPQSLETVKKTWSEKKRKLQEIHTEKTELLSDSIEDQLSISFNSYMTYLMLEKNDGGKWTKAFEMYEKFQKCEDLELLGKAYKYMSYIEYGDYDESEDTKKTS